MARPEEETKTTPETPKQIIRIIEIFDASILDRVNESHDLNSLLNNRGSVYQYEVFTESPRGFFYYANMHDNPAHGHYFDSFDVIITHLLGGPELPKDIPASRFSEIEQFTYPDISDLLKLMHQKGLDIPVILYSTFANHCLLPIDSLLEGSVRQSPRNQELNRDELRTSINKAFEKRQRLKALK